ncbi:putative transporter [Rhodococcus sp. AW25M09]|uniref:YbfB/YjiJ family MFS transporter n=1 Tax=Rhodococcus sp. AW25M09 TaxID=1268303 RepID=UPI0002AC1931|nr:YbfB/YjiJ family MFS transporter [Rhodococcus sp. AW25M09]CCQ15532.1 putative transporter [Rhodococcus sp. AW25M09]
MTGRRISFAAAAGLAAAMGVGRFVFTPLLPMMVGAAEVTPSGGAVIATANYAGYLVGAVVLSLRPSINTTVSFRLWTVLLVGSESGMAAVHSTALFSALRFLAGVASAAIFIACASTVTKHRTDGASPGIAFGGVGAGIAASGILTLLVGPHLSWEALWVCSAVLTAMLVVPAWTLPVHPEPSTRSATGDIDSRTRALWRTLLVAYFLEGLGYIIVGTFLVAAVGGHGNTSVGPTVWIVVGLAAVPATVLWQGVARRTSMRNALVAAFALQSVAALLPALTSNTVAAVLSALLFGGTFMGITMLTMSTAQTLPIGRTAATLTAIYGVGQVLGPLIVAPAIGDSYSMAFAIATAVLILGTAGAVRVSQLTGRR